MDTAVLASSLPISRNQRGKGLTSSIRMFPISRSYTIESEDCMPLKSWIIAIRPGVT
jgi:hypothetical protein